MQSKKNPTRETRILDTALKLFLNYSFDKTTISEIAREAGVSKGAIYLHFSSKDSLLEALIIRELTNYGLTWVEMLTADPQGGTIGGMYKNSLYALSSSQLMAAIFKQDTNIFGTYLRNPNNIIAVDENSSEKSDRLIFVTMMQDAGLIRQDADPAVVAHIMDMIAYSLVSIGNIKSPHNIPPLDAVIEGIAEIMDRALTPDEGVDPEVGKRIVKQIADARQQAFDAANKDNQ